MAQSLSSVFIHLVFSTKQRLPALADPWREELHAYIGGIVREKEGALVAAGSVPDHVHLLIQMPRTETIARLVAAIKAGSSGWIRRQGPSLSDFCWQAGYGVFSVSLSAQPAVKAYIANQAEHHRQVSFQDEFRAFCERHGLDLDERYAWD